MANKTESHQYHRVQLSGFDGVEGTETGKKLQNMMVRYKVEGDWRKSQVQRIQFTTLNRKWTYKDTEYIEKFIAPCGMKEFISELLSAPKCYTSFDVIPHKIKLALEIPDLLAKYPNNKNEVANEYKSEIKQHIKISVTDEGDLGWQQFIVLYCNICTQKNDSVLKQILFEKRGN